MTLLFILIPCIVLYLYSFKFLDAPISSGTRSFLLFCRLGFLLFLLYLVMMPQVTEKMRISQSPTLFVAIDDSLSMSYPIEHANPTSDSNSSSRWEQMIDKLTDGDLLSDWENKGFDLKFSLFSSLAQTKDEQQPWTSLFPKSATPGFVYTDLSSAIQSYHQNASNNRSSFLLLFTDGRWNNGSDPVSSTAGYWSGTSNLAQITNQRIYSFGIGSTASYFDLIVEKLIVPPTGREGESLTTQAHVRINGDLVSKRVTTQIRCISTRNKELHFEEKVVELNDQTREKILSFNIPSLPAGDYSVVVETLTNENELYSENNKLVRGLRIRDAKDPILMLSSAPDWESKFLERNLEEQGIFDVHAYLMHENGLARLGDRRWIEQQTGNPYESKIQDVQTLSDLQPILNRWSTIILHNLRFSTNHLEFAQALRDYIENGGGVLFVPGPLNTNPQPPNIRDILPKPLAQNYMMVQQPVSPVIQSASQHGFQTVFQSVQSNELPPLSPYFQSNIQSIVGTTLLNGLSALNENVPLVQLHRFGLGRIITTHSNAFWRWSMMTPKQVTKPFWISLLYRANPNLQTGQHQLYTDGSVYETYETVRILYRSPVTVDSVTLASIPVEIYGPENNQESLWLYPSDTQINQYEENYVPTKTGNYRVASQLNNATSEFQVVQSKVESYDLRQNVTDLRAIAEQTAGEYANFPAWETLAESIPSKTMIKEEPRQRFLGEKWWAVLTLIALLALEWYMRWLRGLP